MRQIRQTFPERGICIVPGLPALVGRLPNVSRIRRRAGQAENCNSRPRQRIQFAGCRSCVSNATMLYFVAAHLVPFWCRTYLDFCWRDAVCSVASGVLMHADAYGLV